MFNEERFTDLNFADDAVIFAENMQSLVESLTALNQESESLGLRVSWMKTSVFLSHSIGAICTYIIWHCTYRIEKKS